MKSHQILELTKIPLFLLFLFWLVSSQLLFTYTCDVFVKSTSRVPPPLSWEHAGMLSLFFFWWPTRSFLQNYLQFFVKILLGNYFKVWLENWLEIWLRNMIIFDTVAIFKIFFRESIIFFPIYRNFFLKISQPFICNFLRYIHYLSGRYNLNIQISICLFVVLATYVNKKCSYHWPKKYSLYFTWKCKKKMLLYSLWCIEIKSILSMNPCQYSS